jgi:hypothetical protein
VPVLVCTLLAGNDGGVGLGGGPYSKQWEPGQPTALLPSLVKLLLPATFKDEIQTAALVPP